MLDALLTLLMLLDLRARTAAAMAVVVSAGERDLDLDVVSVGVIDWERDGCSVGYDSEVAGARTRKPIADCVEVFEDVVVIVIAAVDVGGGFILGRGVERSTVIRRPLLTNWKC